MKIHNNPERVRETKEEFRMMHEHRKPTRHIPPHERKAMLNLEFDEQDWILLEKVFGDEDTASAAAQIIHNAPPEIQILAVQLIDMIKEVV